MVTRVFVYDDNIGRQEALKMLLETTNDMVFAGARVNCSSVELDLKEAKPDVVLMDIDMPKVNGIKGLKIIRQCAPKVYIIMQTVFEDEEKIFEAIHAGAHGYFLKKTQPLKLIEGIRDVLDGGAPMTPSVAKKVLEVFNQQHVHRSENHFDLTPREKEILAMLAKGMSYKMIADSSDISFNTVNSHLKKIYEKLHVHSATEAVILALEKKIV
ncbi:MAG: response regulator transcription factor [Saprospiraceae bacterium]